MPAQLTTHDAKTLIADIYDADETLNASAFAALLSPDAVFQLGGTPAIQGRDQILAFVQELFSSLHGIDHRLIHFWIGDGKLVFQGEVTFTLPTGQSLMLPYVDIVTPGDGGLLKDYRIYIDLTPMNPGATAPPK
jgi:uncharacterized protein (TIGR02246 family)